MTERPSCSRLLSGERDDTGTTIHAFGHNLPATFMTKRTSSTSVTFRAPFRLPGIGLLPAGTYALDTDEEAFESNTGTVYRWVATTLHIPTGGGLASHRVELEDLEAAQKQDGQATIEASIKGMAADNADLPASSSSKKLWRWVPLWVRHARSDGRP